MTKHPLKNAKNQKNYLTYWQGNLITKLTTEVAKPDYIVWQWLGTHGDRLYDADPDEQRAKVLLETIETLRVALAAEA